MKALVPLISIAGLLVGCGSPEFDYRATYEKNGLRYDTEEDRLVSGVITNYPNPMISSNIFGQISLSRNPSLRDVECQVEFDKGLAHGEFVCELQPQGNPVIFMEYEEGELHGVSKAWDLKTGNQTRYIEYQRGKKHGDYKKWHKETEKLIYDGEEKHGKTHGIVKRWDEETGALVYQGEYKDDKRNGRERRWNQEGDELLTDMEWQKGEEVSGFITHTYGEQSACREEYKDSKLHGTKTCTRTGKSGVPLKVSEEAYKNGILHGSKREWDQEGNLVEEYEYDEGSIISMTERKFSGSEVTKQVNWVVKDIDQYRSLDGRARNEAMHYKKEEYVVKHGVEIDSCGGRPSKNISWDAGKPVSGFFTRCSYSDVVHQYTFNGSINGENNAVVTGQEIYAAPGGDITVNWENEKAVSLTVKNGENESVIQNPEMSFDNIIKEIPNFCGRLQRDGNNWRGSIPREDNGIIYCGYYEAFYLTPFRNVG